MAAQPTAKRSSAARLIPEEIQVGFRERMRLARISRGKSREEAKAVSSSTVTGWELREMSTARLGDLYAWSHELGMPFVDFMQYLVGDEEIRLDSTSRSRRLNVYMASLPEEMQELACNLIQQLVNYHVDSRERARMERAPGVRRNAREQLREAFAERESEGPLPG